MKFEQLEECLACWFNNSGTPFYLSNELVVELGGQQEVEKLIANWRVDLAPRHSSQNRPWTQLDYDLLLRNIALGKRHWQYKATCIVGSTNYHGYGHETDQGFQFYKWNPERQDCLPVVGRSSW